MRYVVVGAGSAGCVVAARLSADLANEVVLLESGPDRSSGLPTTNRCVCSGLPFAPVQKADHCTRIGMVVGDVIRESLGGV